MFDGTDKKLERASLLLNDLKSLAKKPEGLMSVNNSQRPRTYVDAFFFELLSAKDFFLQGINDDYNLGLKRTDATDISKLKDALSNQIFKGALGVVKSIEKNLISRTDTWQWALNNYRNAATHRELLSFHMEANFSVTTNDTELFNKMKQLSLEGKLKVKLFDEVQKEEIQKKAKLHGVINEVKVYLHKDPEDSSQGNLDIEVIPYLEQALENMKGWLEGLYAKL